MPSVWSDAHRRQVLHELLACRAALLLLACNEGGLRHGMGDAGSCARPGTCPPCSGGTVCVDGPDGLECTPTCKDSRDCPPGRNSCFQERYGTTRVCVYAALLPGPCDKACELRYFGSECNEATGILTETVYSRYCGVSYRWCPKGCINAPDMGDEQQSASCLP